MTVDGRTAAPPGVLPLDEEERWPLRLAHDRPRPVRLTVRQVWPELVAEPLHRLSRGLPAGRDADA